MVVASTPTLPTPFLRLPPFLRSQDHLGVGLADGEGSHDVGRIGWPSDMLDAIAPR
jgi:hypothetical protein